MSKWPTKTVVKLIGNENKEWTIHKASLEHDEPWIRFKTTGGRDVVLVLSSRDTLIVEDHVDVEQVRTDRKARQG